MIKIFKSDGSVTKIKRRKKRKSTGRKRGRPRKVKEIEKPLSKKRPYSIIITSKGKQKTHMGTFRTEEEVYSKLACLLEENKKINFPVKFIYKNELTEAKYELFIIKRLDNDDIDETSYLRDDYGNFIKHATNNENWKIIDKYPWVIEETFWVHGYDPFLQRKNFDWVLNNLIINDFLFKNILVYNNKLIIDSDGNVDIIFCKNVSDSYRLYNEIESYVSKHKFKNILFSGSINSLSKQTISAWIDKLCDVTGFNRKKITRKTLSH